MFAVETEDGNAEPRMFVALPLNHVVLGLAQITVLRPEERAKPKQFAVVALEDFRRVLELRRDGSGMKQRSDPRTVQPFRPKLFEMIEWKKNGGHFRFSIFDCGSH